jgi:hypothetical protein
MKPKIPRLPIRPRGYFKGLLQLESCHQRNNFFPPEPATMKMNALNPTLWIGKILIPLAITHGFATAATITGVSIKEVSSTFSAARSADNIINGAGFTEATGYHSNAGGDNISWTSASSTANPLPHFITIDLGANYDLSFVKIWNWNTSSSLSAGSKDIDISVAASVEGGFTSLGSFVLTIGPGLNNVDFGQVINLSGFAAADNTRLVRIDIKSNHGWSNASFPGLAGLSEIRFDGALVPEPSVLAAFGLGAFALLGRRRRG